uniref:Uncharacterized protein n=1 Tax=Anguilla anguilla TaxID=7936 RepID=A0A0E9Q3S5_ANGAN
MWFSASLPPQNKEGEGAQRNFTMKSAARSSQKKPYKNYLFSLEQY